MSFFLRNAYMYLSADSFLKCFVYFSFFFFFENEMVSLHVSLSPQPSDPLPYTADWPSLPKVENSENKSHAVCPKISTI